MKNFTIKSLLAVFVTVSAVVGCSNDEEVALNQCFPTTVSLAEGFTFELNYTSDRVTSATTTLEYDGVKETQSAVISYDAKGNLIKVEDDNSYTAYSYNDNNLIIREEYYEGTALYDRTDYEYNSTGQLIKAQYYDTDGSSVATKSAYEVYTYSSTSSKNPLTEKQYDSSGEYLYYSLEYEYDDKKTWYSSIAQGIVFSQIAAAENNVTKATRKDESGDVQSTTTYVYEYNDKGYPTKATYTQVFSGGSETSVQTFSYNCK